MSLLAKSFRKSVAKDPRQREAVFDVGYPTGFLALDFMNGAVVKVNNGSQYYSLGIVDGTAVTYIGRPGCGKTTLAVQTAKNIVRPFPQAVIFYDDIEGGSTGSRRQTLTSWSHAELEERLIYRNSGISAENFYTRIDTIYTEKLQNKDNYEYDTGLFDPNGNRIFKFEPTVYIVDSLALLTPEKIADEDELSGQMSASAIARANTSIFKRIVQKLKTVNIILLVINHINDKIDINSFSKTKSQVAWLKPGETLPGGKAAIYLANNMFRLDDNTKLKENEEFGVYGICVDLTIVKSRTNASGTSIPLVLDYMNGFDTDLSLFMFLKESNELLNSGAKHWLADYPDMTFTKKKFKGKLSSDPDFREAFELSCLKKLKELIRINTEVEEDTNMVDIQSSILSRLAAVA